ncbi:ribosomal protein S1 [Coriobacteriaceae bacterium EMTCatB1]|nr:ribosomal protein S1 [Coriobacteriaceae bacterium EMTCatB1]
MTVLSVKVPGEYPSERIASNVRRRSTSSAHRVCVSSGMRSMVGLPRGYTQYAPNRRITQAAEPSVVSATAPGPSHAAHYPTHALAWYHHRACADPHRQEYCRPPRCMYGKQSTETRVREDRGPIRKGATRVVENDSIIEQDKDYTDEEMHALIDGTITDFDDGDLVTGTVVKVERDEVLLDIGYKSEGVIPARELSIRKDADPSDVVKVGDTIEALVLQKEDKDGRLILSRKRAAYERAWVQIEEKFQKGENVVGEVIEVVKGGLILDIGLRGFLPASLVDLRRVKDLHAYLGEKLECRIIEMDRNRNNVVLSRRVVLEEDRKQERQEILSKLVKGMILPGTVSSIVDFGAFVDLGGIDGLVHISELSWSHVNHPSEVVSVGDKVEVQVLDVDLERERISLGLKQTQEDPWKQLVQGFEVGQLVSGKVTKLVPFGAFVEIGEGVEGLVHISEMARGHVEKAEDVVTVGQEVQVKIMEIDPERRRISLSIRAANEELGIEDAIPETEEEAEAEEAPEAEAAETAAEEPAAEAEAAEEAAPEEPAAEAEEPEASDEEPAEEDPAAE